MGKYFLPNKIVLFEFDLDLGDRVMFSLFRKLNKKCLRLLKPYEKKNRYQFLDAVGRGGLAEVSTYFDSCLNRIVALKELKKKNNNNPHLLQAFITESKLHLVSCFTLTPLFSFFPYPELSNPKP